MFNATPYEIIASPFTLYRHTALTAKPAIDDDEAALTLAGWTKVGSNGDLNYTEEGVTIEFPQTTTKIRAAGDTGARKIIRVTEDFIVRLSLMDSTLEQITVALNGNAVSTATSGGATVKKIGLSRGPHVKTYALLVRGPSPYMEDGLSQFHIPLACENGSPTVSFNKQGAAAWALAFDGLVNSAAPSAAEYFGTFEAQTEAT